MALHLGSWVKFVSGWRLAPFVPTPHDVATRMLALARLAPGERCVDLGCGDGRLLHAAVRDFGAASAIGYETDAKLAAEAAAVDDARVRVRCADALTSGADLRDADVVTLYLSDRGNATLLPLLRESLRPSARVVSFMWEMPIKPTRTVTLQDSGAWIHLFEGVGRRNG